MGSQFFFGWSRFKVPSRGGGGIIWGFKCNVINEKTIKIQKEKIAKENPKMVGLIVKWVEKVGNEKNNLENDIELALDIIKEKQ